MRLTSLYKFYQKYFGYPETASDKKRLIYAFAIKNAVSVMKDVYEKKNYKPFEDYIAANKNALAITFLENAEKLASTRYDKPLKALRYMDAEINIDEMYLSSRRRGIIIPCPFIFDSGNADIIFLTFSHAYNMENEIKVFLGLTSEFIINPHIPQSTKTITYWNLAKGEEVSRNIEWANKVTRSSLLSVLNTL